MREINDENYLEELFIKEVENAGSGGGDTSALQAQIDELSRKIDSQFSEIELLTQTYLTNAGTYSTNKTIPNINDYKFILAGIGNLQTPNGGMTLLVTPVFKLIGISHTFQFGGYSGTTTGSVAYVDDTTLKLTVTPNGTTYYGENWFVSVFGIK